MQPVQTEIAAPEPGAIRKVLIVDDSRLQLRIMRSILERWGFDVAEADSGEAALAAFRDDPPDLIVSDWMMPGMDGLDLCRHIRAESGEAFSYFILLTSKSEKDEVAQGLDAGADDFLTKPVNSHELRARINAGARIVGMERQLSEKNREVSRMLSDLRTIHEAIDNDLRQARTIQQSLVPEKTRVIAGSRVSLMMRPCGHVGGDLVGMFAPGSGRLGLYCIDVSGHGITSAMVTAQVAGYLSSKFLDHNLALEKRFDRFYAMRPPEVTAELLNQRLCADPGTEEYLTMALITADLRNGRIRMVQAGHPPAILLRASGEVELLGEGGLPIGLVDAVSYDPITCELAPGDRVLLYSDGFTEAITRSGDMLGEEGLADLLRMSAAQAQGTELLDDLYWRFTTLLADPAHMEDDVSAALLEFGLS